MRQRLFRTQVRDIRKTLDEDWVKEIGSHARSVWVLFPGLFRGDQPTEWFGPNHGDTIRLEKHLRAITPVGTRAAFLGFFYSHIPFRGESMYEDYYRIPDGDRRLEVWKRMERMKIRVRLQCRRIWVTTGLPVHVYAEDFAVRWVIRSGFQAASYVFDTPMLTVDEAEISGQNPAIGNARVIAGVPRREHRWASLKFPATPATILTAGLPARFPLGRAALHGTFENAPTLKEVVAIRRGRAPPSAGSDCGDR